jgi:hypothetical protein
VAYQTPGPSATPDTFDANPATTYTGLTIAQNSVPTVSFTCGVTTITGPEQTVLLHLAMGSGTNLVAGENIYSTFATYSLDTIGLAAGTNTCSNSGDGFSNYYSSAGGIEDVAADGVNVAGLFGPQSSDYFIVTTTQTANVTEPIYVNSPGLMDSLGMWYGQIAAIQPGVAAGLNDFIFINIASGSSGALEQTTGNLVPVAAAPDNAGNEYVLANNGYVYICPLGAAYQTVGSCANATYVGNLIPSTNHRALAVGPDGNPWIATSVGLVRAFVSNDSALTYVYGNKSYTQVVASGDGHLYALRSNGQTVDIFP